MSRQRGIPNPRLPRLLLDQEAHHESLRIVLALRAKAPRLAGKAPAGTGP